jgi:acetylornithine deacetylase/succinyl-diaminopimelate desuccinylase-like protein
MCDGGGDERALAGQDLTRSEAMAKAKAEEVARDARVKKIAEDEAARRLLPPQPPDPTDEMIAKLGMSMRRRLNANGSSGATPGAPQSIGGTPPVLGR